MLFSTTIFIDLVSVSNIPGRHKRDVHVYIGVNHVISAYNITVTLDDIPKNSENKPQGLYFSKALFEGLVFGGAFIRRDLTSEGNLSFKIDWAGLIVGSKFTVFDLFDFEFEGNFLSANPGELIFGGAILRRVFCVTGLGGLRLEGLKNFTVFRLVFTYR